MGLAVLLAAAGSAALLVWHLQRPDPPRLRLSFARFLPPPPPETAPEPRLALRLPWRSAGFWLRMGAVLAALAAVLLPFLAAPPLPVGQSIGLRLVVDVTHSMGLPDGAGTRLDTARAEAGRLLARAEEAAEGGPFCAELVAVAAGPLGPPQPAAQALPALAALAAGGEPAALLAAALGAAARCPVTHVVVLTDQPQPAGEMGEAEGPAIIWRQVGAPVPNAGLRPVALRPAGLAGTAARLEFEVALSGSGLLPQLSVQGPGGMVQLALSPATDRDSLLRGEMTASGPGAYTATVTGGGSYAGDDRISFRLTDTASDAVDWQLDWPAPAALRLAAPGDGVLVAPLERADAAAGRPALLVHDGWREGGRIAPLGAFVDDPLVTGLLNLDILEGEAPAPVAGTLPAGFVPVLADTSGRALIARRTTPPGLILPAPEPGRGENIAAMSQLLFWSGLSELVAGRAAAVEQVWRTAAGQEIAAADRESDSARPLLPATEPSFAPRAAAAGASPSWPWLALAALALLLGERILALYQHLAARRAHAV